MSKEEYSIKTKKYTHYPECWWHWWSCALPLRIDIENYSKDYFEIDVQILFGHFTYTRVSHKFSAEVDTLFTKRTE